MQGRWAEWDSGSPLLPGPHPTLISGGGTGSPLAGEETPEASLTLLSSCWVSEETNNGAISSI